MRNISARNQLVGRVVGVRKGQTTAHVKVDIGNGVIVTEEAGTVDESGKNARLRHTLLVTGRDGYATALAIGEIDPHYEGKQVILAYAGGEPPASLTSLRLVVPGDLHGGRSVREVAAIEVR